MIGDFSLPTLRRMNSPNPYSAPVVAEYAAGVEIPQFDQYTPAQLKKLYYRSCNVSCITFLMGLGCLLLSGIGINAMNDPDFAKALPMPPAGYLALGLLEGVACVGLVMRTSWGRVMGICLCILSLINIPIGTLIGLAGLFAFFGAKELFGDGRITHKSVKAAFKEMKKNKRRR